MNVQAAYDDWSETYDLDKNLTRDLDQVVTWKTLTDSRCRSILEIGCGTGKNTAFLSQIADEVHAIDFAERMIEIAKGKVTANNVTFSIANITKPWAIDSESVDLLVCNLVLEHIADLSFVFAQAFRSLAKNGRFFICELHPFRQYQGTQANYQRDRHTIEIPAFVHHISDFLDAAENNGLRLKELREWWHEADQNKPPRLVSFMFEK